MRLLFLGDIVGRSGRKAVVDALPGLRRRYALDFVIINGENSAGGFGITEAILDELIEAGADAVTLGNHAFDQKDALVFIERYPQLIRPINYPKGTPGRGASLLKTQAGADVQHADGKAHQGQTSQQQEAQPARQLRGLRLHDIQIHVVGEQDQSGDHQHGDGPKAFGAEKNWPAVRLHLK